jgi:hypothetical protein
MAPAVTVLVANAALREALVAAVRGYGHVEGASGFVDELEGDQTVIVTTTTDCDVEQCSRLSRLGRAVIVLSALPRAGEIGSYVRAGAAAFLPLGAATAELLTAVADAASRVREPTPLTSLAACAS